ncbi:calcium-binding protein [Phaeobacter sp. PT47_59]|uniref:calcium-binding protein n=1 Tax=Phaeobacter sp. PT47_59 TaxID=3029979 RepID=UPI00238058CE|nr:calcium-binding protein [Phaeobacter sp. PT47_59]MDE4174708.1 calcium-binding protein [Phaeobacter sp. PT47_59]
MTFVAEFEEHTRLSYHDMIEILAQTLAGFDPRSSGADELRFRVEYTRSFGRNHEETYRGYLAIDGSGLSPDADDPELSGGLVSGIRIRIGGERIRIETPDLTLAELATASQSDATATRFFTDQNWSVEVNLGGSLQGGGGLLPLYHQNVPRLDSEFFGGPEDDIFVSGRGDDVMRGRAGDDTLWGGSGNDSLSGGSGDDVLSGSGGHDRLRGGDGADRLFGGAGRDRLHGGDGNDRLDGGGGDDTIVAGAGYDWIYTSFHHTHGGDVFVFSDNDDLNLVRSTRDRYNRVDLSRVSEIVDFQDLVDNHVTFYEAGEYIPPSEHEQGYQDLMGGLSFAGAVIDDGAGTIILLSGYHRLAHFYDSSPDSTIFIF